MMQRIIIGLILVLSLYSCVQQSESETEKFLKTIDEKVPQLLNDFSVPGAAIAVIEDGKIILQKGYGFANVEEQIKVTINTGFNVGSISKVITAWGIMTLVNEGKIDLDEPAEKYLTRWKFPDSKFNSSEVTIRRLLSHSAGISLHSVSAGPPYDNLPTLEEWLNGKNNGLGKVEIIIEPGIKPQYSGGGFAVCQLIIEEVSGQKFEDYIQNNVLDPLGMKGSSFKIDDKILNMSASPYDSYRETTDFELFTIQAGAGLHTTLEDFTRFVLASMYQHENFMSNNPVLSKETMQEMMQPVSKQMGSWAYGLGYQTFQNDTSKKFRGHGGSNHGWQANFWLDPDSQDGFIVLTNSGAGSNICNPIFCEWVNWKTGKTPWSPCEPQPSIATKLKHKIDENGIEEISKSYKTLKSKYGDEIDFSESQLNNLGYYYLAEKDFVKAESVFKLNTEIFPNSYNVYDSYGEVLLAKGNKEESIANYIKSLKINAGNSHGLRVLNDLGISNQQVFDSIATFSRNEDRLTDHTGHYQKASDEKITIQKKEKTLSFKTQNGEYLLVPQSDTRFQVLGDDGIVSFFTTANNQKGLWTNQTIWRKTVDVSSQLPKTKLQDLNFLVLRDNASWNRPTDFEDVLAILDYNYEQKSSHSMADLNLNSYDVLIIPGGQKNEFYEEYVLHSEKFDQYVSNGGTLILELNGAEEVINKLPNGVSLIANKAIENHIIDSSHPILLPFTGVNSFEARYASMSYFKDVPDNAIILTIESEAGTLFKDRPTFIEYVYGEGRVIAASQCFHDRDGSGRGPLMESVVSYALRNMKQMK